MAEFAIVLSSAFAQRKMVMRWRGEMSKLEQVAKKNARELLRGMIFFTAFLCLVVTPCVIGNKMTRAAYPEVEVWWWTVVAAVIAGEALLFAMAGYWWWFVKQTGDVWPPYDLDKIADKERNVIIGDIVALTCVLVATVAKLATGCMNQWLDASIISVTAGLVLFNALFFMWAQASKTLFRRIAGIS